MKISACLVTRGDCDLTPILDTLSGYDEIVVWDNSKREDLGIYGRYAAVLEAKHAVCYTQDDDVLVNCHDQLRAAYEPGCLVANYPEPMDIVWVARGALFDKDLPQAAFRRYLDMYSADDFFLRFACDGIFSGLTPCHVIDEGSVDLPHGFDQGRVSTSPGWYDVKRPEIIERCQRVNAR